MVFSESVMLYSSHVQCAQSSVISAVTGYISLPSVVTVPDMSQFSDLGLPSPDVVSSTPQPPTFHCQESIISSEPSTLHSSPAQHAQSSVVPAVMFCISLPAVTTVCDFSLTVLQDTLNSTLLSSDVNLSSTIVYLASLYSNDTEWWVGSPGSPGVGNSSVHLSTSDIADGVGVVSCLE